MVSDPRVGAIGYTGSRTAGLKLKTAADAVGKPIYLELSSVNPVIILPGANEERMESLVEDYVTSSLMGAGQFCTNPGIVLIPESETGRSFIAAVQEKFDASPGGTLLSAAVEKSLLQSIAFLGSNGATRLTTNSKTDDSRFCCPNALLTTTGENFINNPEAMQTEAFGNASLFVTYQSIDQLVEIIDAMEGNLTGCIYSHTGDLDDSSYRRIAPHLAQKVGRLLNDKMPTGVAVSSAMNHGGPYPATGHPGHTAVGIPGTIRRFAMLQCYDNVRQGRLPRLLGDGCPSENTWRLVDGRWTNGDVQPSV